MIERFLSPGILFARYLATYKIGFPGWPEPILDSVTGFGASIKKEGACTGPLFHFSGASASILRAILLTIAN
jgi:hypothetical protein